MKKFWRRLAVAWVFVALLPGPNTGQQQDKSQASTQSTSQQAPAPFVGVWKLRVDKTQTPGTFSQIITIQDQGKDYKFTYDVAAGNGPENHWWYVTDMKGETVKPVQMNGQPMPSSSRVTRIDSNSFKVEGKVQKDIFSVSADGQTMKLQRTWLVQVGRPNMAKDALMMFDRQK